MLILARRDQTDWNFEACLPVRKDLAMSAQKLSGSQLWALRNCQEVMRIIEPYKTRTVPTEAKPSCGVFIANSHPRESVYVQDNHQAQ
jgi:hypothetical protein